MRVTLRCESTDASTGHRSGRGFENGNGNGIVGLGWEWRARAVRAFVLLVSNDKEEEMSNEPPTPTARSIACSKKDQLAVTRLPLVQGHQAKPKHHAGRARRGERDLGHMSRWMAADLTTVDHDYFDFSGFIPWTRKAPELNRLHMMPGSVILFLFSPPALAPPFSYSPTPPPNVSQPT